jgi:hypothetical protein
MPHLVAILLGPGTPRPVMIFDVQRCESVAGWEVDPTSDPITASASILSLLLWRSID